MKKILFVLLALAFIYLALCVIGPSNVHVHRSITINAPADVIKTNLADYKFFPQWSPWQEKDPNLKSTVSGEIGKPGSKYEWEGNDKVGKGSMVLGAIGTDTVWEKVAFVKPRQGGGDIYFALKGEGAGTSVTWGMKFDLPFFARAMMLFMNMEKQIAPDFEKGLANLKKVIESTPVGPKTYQGFEVKEVAWEERTYVGKKGKMSFEKLSPFFAENFPKISAELAKGKIKMAGAPSSIYFSWNDTTKQTEVAAVLPIEGKKDVKGWEIFSVPAGKALLIEYRGGYRQLDNAHKGIDDYKKEKGLSHSFVIEEYATDPMVEKDSAKWLTNIYYILK